MEETISHRNSIVSRNAGEPAAAAVADSNSPPRLEKKET